jgi:hypothetical protein
VGSQLEGRTGPSAPPLGSAKEAEIEYPCIRCGLTILSDAGLRGKTDICPKCRSTNPVPHASFYLFIPPFLLAALASIVIVVCTVLELVSFVHVRETADMVGRIDRVKTVSASAREALDRRNESTSMATGTMVVLSLVMFFCWKYRAYSNLRALRANQMRFSPAGAIGWYFCPIASLWKPFQAMADIWLGSRPLDRHGDSLGLVWVWWTCWLALPICTLSLIMKEIVSESIQGVLEAGAFAHLSYAGTLLMNLVIMWAVTQRQVQRQTGIKATPPRQAAESHVAPALGGYRPRIAQEAIGAASFAMLPLAILVLAGVLGLMVKSGPSFLEPIKIMAVVFLSILVITTFFTPIVAVSRGSKAMALIDAYPGRYAGKKLAATAVIIGTVEILGWVFLGLFTQFRYL